MWGPLLSSEWKQVESYTVHNHSWCNWKAKNCPWSTERWPCHFRVWNKYEEVSRSLPTVVCSWRGWIKGCSWNYFAQFPTITQWRWNNNKRLPTWVFEESRGKNATGVSCFHNRGTLFAQLWVWENWCEIWQWSLDICLNLLAELDSAKELSW